MPRNRARKPMTLRLLADPMLWIALVVPLLALAEWLGARSDGYVGPALFLAGCVMALPIALRLALTPAWWPDLLVIAAGIFLAVYVHTAIGHWTGVHQRSQPGSLVLVVPTLLIAAALVFGSLAQLVLWLTGALPALRAALEPLMPMPWRALAAAAIAAAAYAAT